MATITLYGTRGGIAYDSPDNATFGANTSSVGIRTDANDLYLFDAGTGLIGAERDILANRPRNLYLGLSHAHYDHIIGLGMSKLPYIPGMNVQIIGSIEHLDGLADSFRWANFPVPYSPERMKGIDFAKTNRLLVQIPGDRTTVDLGDATLDVMAGNHPGGSLLYRLNVDGASIVYATDQEIDYAKNPDGSPKPLDGSFGKQYRRFVEGANLLIADAQYTRDEYVDKKPMDVRGWGHTYGEQILDIASNAGIERVVLTHHDARRTDNDLAAMEERMQRYATGTGIDVQYARQGTQLTIGPEDDNGPLSTAGPINTPSQPGLEARMAL